MMLTVDVTKTDHGLRACPSCPLSTLTSNVGNVQRDAAFFVSKCCWARKSLQSNKYVCTDQLAAYWSVDSKQSSSFSKTSPEWLSAHSFNFFPFFFYFVIHHKVVMTRYIELLVNCFNWFTLKSISSSLRAWQFLNKRIDNLRVTTSRLIEVQIPREI